MVALPALQSQTLDLPRIAMAGAQMGQINRQNQMMEARQQYAPGVISGDPQAMQSYAAVDPEGFMQLREAATKIAEAPYEQWAANMKPVADTLTGLLQADPMQAQAAWPQIREQAAQMGMDPSQLPDQWDPQWGQKQLLRLGMMDEFIKETQGSVPQGYTRQAGGGLQIDPGYLAGESRLKAAGAPQVNIHGDAYKPQTPMGKAVADRKYLTEKLGYPEDHPAVQALDRETATAGKPSGEAARFTEMAETGAQTVEQIMDAYLPEGPEGEIDQSVTTGAYANLPFTQARATRAQFEEAASFILRMETGAQANEQEIQNVADRYKPKPWDPPEVQKDKLMRLKRRFENATSIQRTGELGEEDIPAKATSTATGPNGQKAYLVEGKWVDENGKPIEGQ